MFAGGITGLALFRADLAPTCYASLELRSHFIAGSLFEGIGATGEGQQARDCDENREGPHPLILGINVSKSIRRLNPACSMPQSGMIVLKQRIK